MIGPVLAQTARLVFIAAGGGWLSTHDATAQGFFLLAAASMVLLGVLSCLSVMLTRWGPKQPVPVVKVTGVVVTHLPLPVTPAMAAAADIGDAHQLRDHAHQLAAADAAGFIAHVIAP